VCPVNECVLQVLVVMPDKEEDAVYVSELFSTWMKGAGAYIANGNP